MWKKDPFLRIKEMLGCLIQLGQSEVEVDREVEEENEEENVRVIKPRDQGGRHPTGI